MQEDDFVGDYAAQGQETLDLDYQREDAEKPYDPRASRPRTGRTSRLAGDTATNRYITPDLATALNTIGSRWPFRVRRIRKDLRWVEKQVEKRG
jgi:hypothetical protein